MVYEGTYMGYVRHCGFPRSMTTQTKSEGVEGQIVWMSKTKMEEVESDEWMNRHLGFKFWIFVDGKSVSTRSTNEFHSTTTFDPESVSRPCDYYIDRKRRCNIILCWVSRVHWLSFGNSLFLYNDSHDSFINTTMDLEIIITTMFDENSSIRFYFTGIVLGYVAPHGALQFSEWRRYSFGHLRSSEGPWIHICFQITENVCCVPRDSHPSWHNTVYSCCKWFYWAAKAWESSGCAQLHHSIVHRFLLVCQTIFDSSRFT